MIVDAQASVLLPQHQRSSTASDRVLPSFADPFAALEREIITDSLLDPFAELERTIKRTVFRDPQLPGHALLHPAKRGMTGVNDSVTFDTFDDNFESDPEDILTSAESRKKRAPNLYPYEFGDVFKASWYTKFLHPENREKTYTLSSRDRWGEFRSLFRMPLKKVDEIVDLFLEEGWICPTNRCADEDRLRTKAELLILGVLHVLGHNAPFRILKSSTEICYTVHRKIFHKFCKKMYSIRDRYVFYPRTEEELSKIMERYEAMKLPGAAGSIDVVHLRWRHCPAGDANRCTGKEGYPTVAFEVISGFDREILGVSSIQFGSRNDKHIVKLDKTVAMIRKGWYNAVKWRYTFGRVETGLATGIYLICDGGYLRWPSLMCPYQGASKASREGYFSSNIESVRKDVECVFGILKTRWKILESGIRFRDIERVEQIFNVCCMLHNMMLSEMADRENAPRVGRGAPIGRDAIWLQGETPVPPRRNLTDRALAMEWGRRRSLLAEHLEVAKRIEKRRRYGGGEP